MRDNFIDPYMESLMASDYVEPQQQQQSIMADPQSVPMANATQTAPQMPTQQAPMQQPPQGAPPLFDPGMFESAAMPIRSARKAKRNAWERDRYFVKQYVNKYGANFGPEMAKEMMMSGSDSLAKKVIAYKKTSYSPTMTSYGVGDGKKQSAYYDRDSGQFIDKGVPTKSGSGVSVVNKIGSNTGPMKIADYKNVEIQNKDGDWVNPPLNMSRQEIAGKGGRLKAEIAPGDAGKYVMLKTAQSELPALKSLLMPEGTVDRETLRGTTIENIHPWVGAAARYAGLSSPQSQQMTSILERGMQGITRTETGAAMPADEIQNTKARFMPSSSDSDESIHRKLLAYEYFINNAVDLMNPTGLRNRKLSPEMATAIMGDAVTKAFAESGKDLDTITEEGRRKPTKPEYEDPAKEAAWIKFQKDNKDKY